KNGAQKTLETHAAVAGAYGKLLSTLGLTMAPDGLYVTSLHSAVSSVTNKTVTAFNGNDMARGFIVQQLSGTAGTDQFTPEMKGGILVPSGGAQLSPEQQAKYDAVNAFTAKLEAQNIIYDPVYENDTRGGLTTKNASDDFLSGQAKELRDQDRLGEFRKNCAERPTLGPFTEVRDGKLQLKPEFENSTHVASAFKNRILPNNLAVKVQPMPRCQKDTYEQPDLSYERGCASVDIYNQKNVVIPSDIVFDKTYLEIGITAKSDHAIPPVDLKGTLIPTNNQKVTTSEAFIAIGDKLPGTNNGKAVVKTKANDLQPKEAWQNLPPSAVQTEQTLGGPTTQAQANNGDLGTARSTHQQAVAEHNRLVEAVALKERTLPGKAAAAADQKKVVETATENKLTSKQDTGSVDIEN
ncbi:UNVERIFIED_CONTAM: hypothetical protein HDU68_005960, partial [Siphonaria sp. JEL0065]